MEDGVAVGALVIDDETGFLVHRECVGVIKIAGMHPKP